MEQDLFEKAISEYFTKIVDEENPQNYKFVRSGKRYKRKTYIKTETGFLSVTLVNKDQGDKSD